MRLTQVEKKVRQVGSTGQLANSSIENGAIRAYDGDQQTMQIGRQWDGTYAPTVTGGPVPPTPTYPVVNDGVGSFVAIWDGQFENGAVLPMDFLRVDVHIGDSDDFVPSHDNRFGSIGAPTGGSLTVGAESGTYYVKLVCWTLAGKVSAATVGIVAHSTSAATGSDGEAPASSPAPAPLSGVEAIYVRWTPIANADPVTYEIHISSTSGFTPDETTKAGETQGSIFTIKALPGDAPSDPSEADLRVLQYDTVYYIKIVARDNDGQADPSAEATGNIVQVGAGMLGEGVVTAREVVAGSFTGEEFAGEVFIGSQFKTADAGQRLEWGINGIQQFRSDETRRFYVPPTDDEDVYIDAQVKARGLQVVGGASFEGTQNSIEKDAAFRLASGVSSSSITAPQVSVYYDTIRFNMPTTTPTGNLGTFNLNPTEVNSIGYTPSGKVKVYQYRPNQGTRIWQFHPVTGNYENHFDYVDKEVVGETWNPASPAEGYLLWRWMPDGSGGKNGTDYYVDHSQVFRKYSRSDSTRFPSIGWVGSNVFVAEVLSATGRVQVKQYSSDLASMPGNTLAAPLSTITTATTLNYLAVRPQVIYGSFAGGVGGNRFVVSENGGQANIFSFNASGTWLMDDAFDSPPAVKRGLLYDGSNFWTYGNDGYLYKHTNFTWGASTSSKIWATLTLRRQSLSYETTPGPIGSLTVNRRSNIKITYPALPFAGAGNPEDPDRWVFYAGRGASQPANTAMWKQSDAVDGVAQQVFSDLATSGTNPPTTNNFPGATPGEIRNDDLGLRIKGDGSGRFTSLSVGPAGGTAVDVGTLAANLAGAAAVHIRTTAGTANFVKPAGARFHWVRLWGGGGAGGGTTGAGTGNPGQAEGGGGGGGGYVEQWYLDSDLSSSEAYTVGAGGAGVALGNGNAGGASTFKGLTAGGGGGGFSALSGTGAIIRAQRGAGGTAAGGQLNSPGGDGGTGITISSNSLFINYGGASGGGSGQTQQSDLIAGNGTNGSSPGGGGSGSWSTTAGFAGGAGAAGKIMIVSFF